MNKKGIALSALLALTVALGFTACTKDADTQKQAVVNDSLKMTFRASNHTLYSLKDGKEISLTDSASTKWDIGIKFYNIILNSNASGPGKAGVIVKYGNYDDFKVAPTTGYSYDTTTTKLAIDYNYKSPNSWYNYIPANHGFAPKAGLFFVIKTAEGKYAKLEIVGVNYLDLVEGAMFPKFLQYKFRYFYQKDGSTNLEN